MPPPAVRIKALVAAEGGTPGVSGIQRLLQVAPTVVSPQRVLLQPPSGSKQVGMPPPAVILSTPVVPAEGGDWGGENPEALASSTYCRFTSACLAPAPGITPPEEKGTF